MSEPAGDDGAAAGGGQYIPDTIADDRTAAVADDTSEQFELRGRS